MEGELNNWDSIIDELKILAERIDSFPDRLSKSADVEEYYYITNSLHRILAAANRQTGKAVEAAELLHRNETGKQ